MNKPKYNLSFLPIFQEDLYEVTDYITNTLKNSVSPQSIVCKISSTNSESPTAA